MEELIVFPPGFRTTKGEDLNTNFRLVSEAIEIPAEALVSVAVFQAFIDAHPRQLIEIPAGDYPMDTFTAGVEITVTNGAQFTTRGQVTFRPNNPTRGFMFFAGSDGSYAERLRVISNFGVTRPNLAWQAGDANWVAWRAAWNAAHPYYKPLGNPAVLSMRDAWNAAYPQSLIGPWTVSRGATERCVAFATYDSNHTGFFGPCYVENYQFACYFRGVSADTTLQVSDNYGDIECNGCDMGLTTRQQNRGAFNVVARNGTRIPGAVEPHAIYAENEPTIGNASTNCIYSGVAEDWMYGHCFKFKVNVDVQVLYLTGRNSPGLCVFEQGCSGIVGPLTLFDQNNPVVVGPFGSRTCLDVGDSPGMIFDGLVSSQHRASTLAVSQDTLKHLNILRSDGVQFRGGWSVTCSRLSMGTPLNKVRFTNNAIFGPGYYNDAGNQGSQLWSVSSDGDEGGSSSYNQFARIQSYGSNRLYKVFGASAYNEFFIDARLLSPRGWDDITFVNVGVGPGNFVNRQDLTQTTYGNAFDNAESLQTAAVGALVLGSFDVDGDTFYYNFAAGETVTINGVVYTFAVAVAAAYSVRLGADYSASMINLNAAVNLGLVGGQGAGVIYGVGTLINPYVQSVAAGPELDVLALTPGVGGNAYTTSTNAVHASWGGPTLAGGGLYNPTEMQMRRRYNVGATDIDVLMPPSAPENDWVILSKNDAGAGALVIMLSDGVTVLTTLYHQRDAILCRYVSGAWRYEILNNFDLRTIAQFTSIVDGDMIYNLGGFWRHGPLLQGVAGMTTVTATAGKKSLVWGTDDNSLWMQTGVNTWVKFNHD